MVLPGGTFFFSTSLETCCDITSAKSGINEQYDPVFKRLNSTCSEKLF